MTSDTVQVLIQFQLGDTEFMSKMFKNKKIQNKMIQIVIPMICKVIWTVQDCSICPTMMWILNYLGMIQQKHWEGSYMQASTINADFSAHSAINQQIFD